MVNYPKQYGVMEFLNNTTIDACNNSSENTIKLLSDVVLAIDTEKNIVFFPAPFYDELHFANYE